MRTSLTHPLQIATLRPLAGSGRIGVTFCPGKVQPGAMSGSWDRDLCLDLDAVRDWGAVAVVTLIEDHEIDSLGVAQLGAQVTARHMAWMHLPIPDVSVPGAEFERQWQTTGADLRDRLRAGFDVLVHCKGGLGRAGTIAARLMVELGIAPDAAIAQVRAARPGAIETRAQENFVMGLHEIPEPQPATTGEAIRDRAIGALLGLAIADAVGTTLEFKRRDSYAPLTDMVGGGPFGLKQGEWTDDTAMALALADSLAAAGDLDETDLMQRFVDWHERGSYSCTGTCFDIGITTRQALARWKKTGDPMAGSWRGKARAKIAASGYVAHTLEAALWSVGRSASYRDAVLLAANLGDDADTTAAVTGQLAGALSGAAGLPPDWVAKLAWADPIKEKAAALLI